MKTGLPSFETLDVRQLFAIGGSYVAPVTPRIVVPENAAWSLNNGGTVDLPYVRDSTNGSTGIDTFTKVIPTTSAMVGKKIYLHFEGAYLTTSVSVDGVAIDYNPATAAVDSHNGGFESFNFDLTTAMSAVGNHSVKITVNSNNNDAVSPGSGGDYYRQGGIYRDLSLIVVNPTQIAVQESVGHLGLANQAADATTPIASPGVRFANNDVVIGATGTTVHVTTALSNLLTTAKNVSVATYLVDAAGVIRAQGFTSNVAATNLAAGGASTLTQDMNISSPHLWDGRIDPYLYTLYVEVHDAGSYKLLDLQKQSVGIRTIKINAVTSAAQAAMTPPFMLNGHAYRVVGADMHQDTGLLDSRGNYAGWERSDAQTRADIDLLADMGGTGIRTSHYQNSQAFYDYCDKIGILVYTELNINGSVQNSDAFVSNAEDQYQELIRQNYNHPSIFAWGFGNETGDSSNLLNLVKQLQKIAKGTTVTNSTTGVKTVVPAAGDPTPLDPYRYTAWAMNGGTTPSYTSNGDGTSSPTNSYGVADIMGTHPYTYWYGGAGAPAGQVLQPQGVTEYGGGGAAYQYTDNAIVLPVGSQPNGGVDTNYHPQNQQEQIEQLQYTQLTNVGYLWGQFTWQFFNHPDGKTEGEVNFTNDKGLVTRDRVLKDSYYFYKAALNDPSRNYANQKVLYLSGEFWNVRNSNTPTITVYSNIGTPTLTVNGVNRAMSQLVLSGVTIPGTYTLTLNSATALAVGPNSIKVTGSYGGQTYNDSAVWTYRNAITGTQTARIDFAPTGTTPATGYSLDSGAAYGAKGTQTYGWLPAGGNVLAVGSTFTTGTTALTKDGVQLNFDLLAKKSSVWEYALANGTYDVRIGAGRSAATDGVNNFTLEGKTAAIDSNGFGQDTFYARVTVTDGRLTLAAAPGAFNPRITFIDINAVANDTTAPLVSNVAVNGGAIQRSSISALSVQFTEPVALSAAALSLSLRGTATTYALTPTTTDDGSTYTLALTNGAALRALPDGVYDVVVDNTKVADRNGNTMAASGSSVAATFTRLFGDVDGSRTVDAQDTLAFGFAKNTKAGQSGYRSDLDYDGDGDIDAVDNLRFMMQAGKTVTA